MLGPEVLNPEFVPEGWSVCRAGSTGRIGKFGDGGT
jgi:hypothetical protein